MLKNALLSNAIFSGVSGLMLLLLPNWFAAQLGLESSKPVSEVGIMLLFFSAFLCFLVIKRQFRVWTVVPVIVADFAWVVMSGVLTMKFYPQFSQLGLTLVIVIALIVLLLADLQALGLYRHHRLAAAKV